MRQVGVLAAAGLYALDQNIERLADDHVRAHRIAAALAPFGVVDEARVRTNIVLLDLHKQPFDAEELVAAAAAEGVLISTMGRQLARLVTHMDVDDDGVDEAITVLTRLLG